MRCEVLSVLGFGMEVHIGYHNIDNCSFCSRQCELLCFDLGVNSIALSVPVHTKNGCNAACSWCTVFYVSGALMTFTTILAASYARFFWSPQSVDPA